MTKVDLEKRIRLTHILGALMLEMICINKKPEHGHGDGHKHG
jgi:hypothetical protein